MKKHLLILLLCPTVLFAQADKFKRIDSLLTYYEKMGEYMGSVAIADNGKTVFSKAYGFSDVEKGKRATSETPYKIGSITKMFTASIVFQLIEEGKLTTDTKLSKYYPAIPNADKISVLQLLGHRSGIFNYTNDPSVVALFQTEFTKQMMLDKIKSYEPVFTPGTKSEYSNSNYYLLGLIIEDITKKSYASNVSDRIIKKLGLKKTFYPATHIPAPDDARSYNAFGAKWVLEEPWDNSFAAAAGAMIGTPSDLTVFIKALFDGKIIKETSLAEMIKLEEGYGRGIFPMPFYDKRAYGHTGGIEQFASSVAYFPTEKVALSMIANAKGENNNDVAIGILSIYFDRPFEFPNLERIKVDTQILKSYEGTYSSTSLPITITIVESNGMLTAKVSGQPSLTLETVSETEFVFNQVGLKITFSKDKFMLNQGGGSFEFTKV